MAQLVDDIIRILPEAQREAILKLINDKSKVLPLTRRFQTDQLNRLSRSRDNRNGIPFFNSPNTAKPGDVISSELWNENLENMYIDLYTLYKSMNKLNLEFEQFSVSNDDDVAKLRAAILKVIQQAIIFRFLRDNRDYQEVKILDFTNAINETQYRPKAVIDQDIHALELAPQSRTLLQSSNRGFKTTSVAIKNLGGGIVSSKNDMFGPEKMLDRIPGTFWAQMVMSDMPINQTYITSSSLGTMSSVLNVFGPIAEIEYTLSHPELANSVRVLPFGEYPIRIIDIAYKDTHESTVWKNIEGFTTPNTTIHSWYEINFDPVTIAVLRLTIAQESYTQNIYHLPKSIVYSTDIFQHIVDDLFRRDIGDSGRLDDEFGFIQLDNKAALYLEALDDFSEDLSRKSLQLSDVRNFSLLIEHVDSIARTLTRMSPALKESLLELMGRGSRVQSSKDIVAIKKYQYIFGIREIEFGYSIYNPVGFYSSPKFKTNATITDIELESNDTHIQYEDSFSKFRRSSVEYEVELGPDRILPIVPINSTGSLGEFVIRDEYLRVDRNNFSAKTRFKILSNAVLLRKNGEHVPMSQFSISGNSEGYGIISISGDYFSRNSIYGLTYKPQIAHSHIDVLDTYNSELLQQPERFLSTGPDNRVTLSYYPYVEYEFLNQTGFFIQDDPDISIWRYSSPISPYTSGTIKFFPKITNASGVLSSGNITGYGISTNFTGVLSNTYFTDPYGYEIRFRDFSTTTEISGFSDMTGMTFMKVPEVTEAVAQTFGTAYNTGNYSITSDYTINVTYTADNQTFGMSNMIYEPLTVTVNGTKAKNFTNYQTRIHKAFSSRNRLESSYEFIHRGSNIFFNNPIQGEILVSYRWISQYIRLRATLVNHQPANSVVTPQIHEAKFLLKTSPL